MFGKSARPEPPDGPEAPDGRQTVDGIEPSDGSEPVDRPEPVDGILPPDRSEPPRRDETNTLRYSIIATVVGFLLLIEVMALDGVLEGLSNIGVFRMIEGPSCGLTSFGQDL